MRALLGCARTALRTGLAGGSAIRFALTRAAPAHLALTLLAAAAPYPAVQGEDPAAGRRANLFPPVPPSRLLVRDEDQAAGRGEAVAAAPRAPALDPLEAFEQGVGAYRSGDLENARSLWLEALARAGEGSGLDRAAVLYDLGNVAYRQGRPVEAAAWYTASLRLAPRRADTWANLALARSEAGLEPADRGDLVSTARRIAVSLTPRESGWIAVALWVVLAASLAWSTLRGTAAARRVAWTAALAFALFLCLWLFQHRRASGDPLFVVDAGGARLVSEPRAESPVIDELPPGAEALRLDQLPGWVRVEHNGARGWVRSEAVLPLNAPYGPIETAP